jgi:threonylcarbamoyladenosine tRNA methylthiotransferase MtaB
VPAGVVVAEARRLVEGGCREIVLTGVDITSYGDDLPGEVSLGWLVRQILKHVPDLDRLRLSSIDQVEVDHHLMAAIAEEHRLMPHLHLSMQAGHDMTLKRMKRRHSRSDAIAFCREARRLRPDIVFGADLIAGFPTETEDMFQATLDIVDECGLTHLHVFPFSPRKGTPAARMPQVERQEIKARAARLREKGDAVLGVHFDAMQGREVEVLMERPDVGRTPQFAEVITSTARAVGDVTIVRIAGHDGRRLAGVFGA